MLYAIAAITFFSSYIRVLCIDERFGILYLITGNMMIDILQWFGISFFISVGFGVAYTVLMPANTYGFNRPFWQPFWGILGEFDRDSVDDYFERHSVAYTQSILVEIMIYCACSWLSNTWPTGL